MILALECGREGVIGIKSEGMIVPRSAFGLSDAFTNSIGDKELEIST